MSLRVLLFNIAYGTGPPRGPYHHVVSLYRYLRSERHHIQHICDYVREAAPDIAALIEVERGSLRNARTDQVAVVARALEHNYSYECKYAHESFYRYLPIFRRQGNVLLARETLENRVQHFLPLGTKRLILEAEVAGLRVCLVHLAVTRRVRTRQLQVLSDIVAEQSRPVVVAGDFNTFGGARELNDFLDTTGLRSLNQTSAPTYPSYAPKKELDFILCSPNVTARSFRVDAHAKLSDHLPLIADLEVSPTWL